MLNRLTITFLAGMLALMGLPAFALDLPDSGSKNFSPPTDTPSYFSNETAPVSARTADTTERDWSAVDALAPDRPAAHPSTSAHRGRMRHGKYGSAQRYGKHAPGKSASGKPVWAASGKNAGRGGAPNAAKTTTAKHGKAGAHHARADTTGPAVF
jgi:hypothetical protein